MTYKFNSVSRIPIILSVDHTNILNGELIRYLAPLTINKLVKNFPLTGRINKFKDKFVYIKVDVELGLEKSINSFKRGDIAFSPSGNFLSIFLTDYTYNQNLNLVGRINLDDIELLQNTRTGDLLRINKTPE